MSAHVRFYGTQCDRCGTLLLIGERDDPICAGCAGDEEHV